MHFQLHIWGFVGISFILDITTFPMYPWIRHLIYFPNNKMPYYKVFMRGYVLTVGLAMTWPKCRGGIKLMLLRARDWLRVTPLICRDTSSSSVKPELEVHMGPPSLAQTGPQRCYETSRHLKQAAFLPALQPSSRFASKSVWNMYGSLFPGTNKCSQKTWGRSNTDTLNGSALPRRDPCVHMEACWWIDAHGRGRPEGIPQLN